MKKIWNFLEPGDIVDIVAPASHPPEEKLLGGCAWLESLGLIPRYQENILQEDIFFAAPLKVQLEHLKSALYSDSKAIWCLRGGYGSMRLIPHMLRWKPPKRPKLFIGFSDITSLHLFFNQRWDWPTLHGRVLTQLSNAPRTKDRKELEELIMGEFKGPKVFDHLLPLNSAAREEKSIRGKIVGGNLRILQSSLGTSWQVQAKGKILFIEDIGERGYSIDRMLEQLIQARIIDKGLKALIIGDFTESHEKNGKDLSKIAHDRFAQRVPYPVLRGLPCGHGLRTNYPLPFNTPVELTTGKRGRLVCHFTST